MKEKNKHKLRKFELGRKENMKVRPWIIVGFNQRDREDSQNLNKDNFLRLPVTSAQCIMGTEKHPDGGILLN